MAHPVRDADFAHYPAVRTFREEAYVNEKVKHAGKKLGLVLDLDMTLVHAVQESAFADFPFDSALMGSVKFGYESTGPEIFSLLLDDVPYVLKLRPGVRNFLTELSSLYELNIFTKATRPYLNFLMAALDPDRRLFATAVSRDDAPELDVDTKVMGLVSDRPLSELVIFDDRQTVWRDCPDNVIRAEPYMFLERKMGSLAAAITNRSNVCDDNDRQLTYIAAALKTVHTEFTRHRGLVAVSDVLRKVRAQALVGCRVMFSGLTKDDVPVFQAHVELLGGENAGEDEDLGLENKVTHLLVVGKNNTKKVYDARRSQGKIKALHGSWLSLAISTWSRPPEDAFDLARFPCDVDGRVSTDIDPWDFLPK